ncbi:MAG: ABC transporter ATP-binding protein [Firmicutes bacterium]|nr:ABC transporter ATP-binding protein [Bacillota bacterium]
MLSASDLHVGYGSVLALHGVSLEIKKGELVSICGINGSGKTTIMRTLAGVLKPKSGKITFKGTDITGKKPEQVHKLGVALVPQGREIFPSLTVAENLRIGAFGCYKPAQYQKDLETMFELFPILKERYNQGGGLLSGGEQQMLAIARGLMSNPDLLMLDEPSLGLSPNRVDQIFELIEELKSRGMTILLVEQNAERAASISDRVYLLSNGRVEFSGKAEDMASAIDVASLYMGGKEEVK